VWQDLSWPEEYPLAQNEMSFLLPHFLADGRGRLDTYFIRVYNPVWTNPDGLSWMEVLTDEQKVGCFVALTPTWSESAYFADYVLPMGHASERHDTHSYEQYDGQWIGFRQPVLRAARERRGEKITDTRQVNPGEVWEENEFWIELSWRIDPDGSLGIRQYHESRERPGTKLTVDEYYGWMFANSVPGAAGTGRRRGAVPAGVDAPLRGVRGHPGPGRRARAGSPGRRAGRPGSHARRAGVHQRAARRAQHRTDGRA
jgi:anaerobic selenocysteine-containing dehydrogenase